MPLSLQTVRRALKGPKYINALKYLSGDDTEDATAWAALNTAYNDFSGRVQLHFPNGRYRCPSRHLLQVRSNSEIICDDAEFYVPASATATDNSATDTYHYDNPVFYLPTGTELDNFTLEGAKLVSDHDRFQLIGIGDSADTAVSINRGIIKIIGCEQTGGNTWILMGIHDLLIEEPRHHYIYASAMRAMANELVRITGGKGEYIGVTADEVTWRNVAVLQGNNSRNLSVDGYTVEICGGSNFLIRGASLPIRAVAFSDVIITRAGLAGIAIRAYNASQICDTVALSGVQLHGFNCAPDADLHDGISIGTNATKARCRNVSIENVISNLLAPTETYDEANHTITGSTNSKKAKATAIGTSYCIAVAGFDASSAVENVTVGRCQMLNNKRMGLGISRVVNANIGGNIYDRIGWERDASNDPLGTNHSIFASDCGLVQIANEQIMRPNPGCNGNGSQAARTIPVQFTRVAVGKIDGSVVQGGSTLATWWNYEAVRQTGSSGATLSVTTVNVSAITQANPAAVTTSSAHGLSTGQTIRLSGVGGMTELNGYRFKVTVTGTDSFTLNGIDSSGFGAFTAGGTVDIASEGVDEYVGAVCHLECGPNMTMSGTYRGTLTDEGGFFGKTDNGTMTVADGKYIPQTTSGAGTKSIAAGTTMVMPNNASGHTQQLRDPSAHPDQDVTIKNLGAGTVTVGTAAGTINGTTSLATNAAARYRAKGAVWEEVP